jgi:hypothetical protein
MSDAEVERLIALGRSYKTLDKPWNSEFRGDYDAEDDQAEGRLLSNDHIY